MTPVHKRANQVACATVFGVLMCWRTLMAADAPVASGEAVIPPGHEESLADMLGRGAVFPGQCVFSGGQVDRAVVRGTYKCADGEVVLELRHPSAATARATQTSQFAIVVLSGSPPQGFIDALASNIRSRDSAFEWTLLPPPPPSWLRSHWVAIGSLVAVGFCTGALLWWLVPRLVRRVPAALGWLRQRVVRQAQAAGSGLRLRLVRGRQSVLGWVRPPLVRSGQAVRRFARAPAAETQRILADERFWVVAIFVVSAAARGWLSLVNPEANDDHLIVARMIREDGWQAPASSACLECSHAKLYHYALAAAFEFARGNGADKMAGNLLNFVAGTVLLVFLYIFSRGIRCSPPVRLLALAFMSFNAALVGIFSQATNDGFCILFSSLAIFYVSRFLADGAPKQVVAATIFVILAALSKASGWAIFAAGAIVLCLTFLAARPRVRRKYVVASAVFVVGFLCVVPLVNPYRHNLAYAHTPFVNDAFDEPVNKIEVPRLPVAWIFQDLFTFRIFELIRVPYVDFLDDAPALHRTSLWSQLYGRMFFLRFDQGIWRNPDPRLLTLGRLCFLLGLLPLAALLIGTIDALRSAWRGASVRGLRWFAEDHDWQYLVYIGVLLGALIPFLIQFHRLAVLFTWMKAIYLFPAILPLFKLFLDGLEVLWRWRPRLVTAWMTAMVMVSIADLGWLIRDVMRPDRFH